MTGTPGWAWAAAVGVILGLLAVDLALSRRQPTMRRAVLVSAGWVAAAVTFGGILLAWRGGAAGPAGRRRRTAPGAGRRRAPADRQVNGQQPENHAHGRRPRHPVPVIARLFAPPGLAPP